MISVIYQYIKIIILVRISYLRGYEGRTFYDKIYPKTVKMLKKKYYVAQGFLATTVRYKED